MPYHVIARSVTDSELDSRRAVTLFTRYHLALRHCPEPEGPSCIEKIRRERPKLRHPRAR